MEIEIFRELKPHLNYAEKISCIKKLPDHLRKEEVIKLLLPDDYCGDDKNFENTPKLIEELFTSKKDRTEVYEKLIQYLLGDTYNRSNYFKRNTALTTNPIFFEKYLSLLGWSERQPKEEELIRFMKYFCITDESRREQKKVKDMLIELSQ